MNRLQLLAAGAALMLLAPASLHAETTLEFTGTVTALVEDPGFFEAPEPIDVGSTVSGIITYADVPDTYYDPDPADCTLGYVFVNGTMVVTIEGQVWDYGYVAVLVSDCVASDEIEILGQTANAYPSTAPAHQLVLRIMDLSAPCALVDSRSLPMDDGDLDLNEATRLIGRVVHYSWGEIRFDVGSVTLANEVSVDAASWGQVKALFRR